MIQSPDTEGMGVLLDRAISAYTIGPVFISLFFARSRHVAQYFQPGF